MDRCSPWQGSARKKALECVLCGVMPHMSSPLRKKIPLCSFVQWGNGLRAFYRMDWSTQLVPLCASKQVIHSAFDSCCAPLPPSYKLHFAVHVIALLWPQCLQSRLIKITSLEPFFWVRKSNSVLLAHSGRGIFSSVCVDEFWKVTSSIPDCTFVSL